MRLAWFMRKAGSPRKAFIPRLMMHTVHEEPLQVRHFAVFRDGDAFTPLSALPYSGHRQP